MTPVYYVVDYTIFYLVCLTGAENFTNIKLVYMYAKFFLLALIYINSYLKI